MTSCLVREQDGLTIRRLDDQRVAGSVRAEPVAFHRRPFEEIILHIHVHGLPVHLPQLLPDTDSKGLAQIRAVGPHRFGLVAHLQGHVRA
jgi:hypothetical protein